VAATGRPSAASPVALAVLDTIELKRLSTGDTPLPLPPEERILPRPATAAARARF
jgi:hypothetical protein